MEGGSYQTIPNSFASKGSNVSSGEKMAAKADTDLQMLIALYLRAVG